MSRVSDPATANTDQTGQSPSPASIASLSRALRPLVLAFAVEGSWEINRRGHPDG